MRCIQSSLIFLLTFFLCRFAHAYPIFEKTPDTAIVPINVLSAQPERLFIPTFGDFQDRYLFTVSGSSVTIIDTATWAEYTTALDAFSDSVADVVLLGNGTSLIVALENGNLARIELDDEDSFVDTIEDEDEDEDTTSDQLTDSREIDTSALMTSAGITRLVADPGSSEVVYMINSAGYYYEYGFQTENLTEVSLTVSSTSSDDDTTASSYTPTDIAFAASSSGDTILVTTDAGVLLISEPGLGSFSENTLDLRDEDTESPNLAEMSVTPDGDFAFILDTDNDVVWVFAISSSTFKDQQTGGTSLDPIETTDNSSFSDIFIYKDADDAVVVYLSGESGISILDASDPDSASSDKVIDVDETTTDTDDPITMSATAGLLAASSGDDGMIYSANGDATISVLTENPFVSITAISAETVTATDSSFTLTFQTDTAGTYTMYANSNLTGTEGTELIAATEITTVDTDTTTSSIDINSFERSTFEEGVNKIFIFLDEASGLRGRMAIDLTVDRPPEALTITGVNFGNQKAYVSFTPSEDGDIDYYTMYAEAAEDQSDPSCPESLTFATAATSTLEPTECTDTSCTGYVDDLTNDTTYCVAVLATDLSAQSGPLSSYTTAVTPEQTVGPAAFLGETGCALNRVDPAKGRHSAINPYNFISLGLMVLPFILLRRNASRRKIFLSVSLLIWFISSNAHAIERTPQHWSLEPRVGMWIPTDSGVKQFFSPCCNFNGEVEFGWLHKSRYNVTVTAGLAYETGSAVGLTSGLSSGDTFSLMLFPVRSDFVYRFDFKEDQVFVPFLRVGFDAVVFRENDSGDKLMGVKWGAHGGAGVGVLLDKIESMGAEIEAGGVNDVYLVLEGRYAFINSFQSTGLDLSGFYPYLGFLFEF